jgi:hypothetical protein
MRDLVPDTLLLILPRKGGIGLKAMLGIVHGMPSVAGGSIPQLPSIPLVVSIPPQEINDVVGLPRKPGDVPTTPRRGHQKRRATQDIPLVVSISPQEINDVIFPCVWNARQLRKLYP